MHSASGKTLLSSILLLTMTFGVFGCGSSSETTGAETAAEIAVFQPPQGPIQAGSSASASVRVKNTSAEDRTFFVGYSVRDSAGKWYDAPASPVELGSGEESDTLELGTRPLHTPGYYNSRVSVWSGEPGSSTEAQRLADREETSTFRIYSAQEDFDSPALDTGRWETSSRKLGRGSLTLENVSVEDGQLRVTLPADTLDGGQIESKDFYGPGFYAARIKVPDAPSSITGFFLYEPPDYASEIDIEIYNDSSDKVLFTTYAGGEQTHTETAELPFDPTEDFHDYAFFYDRDSITFYVDGRPMKEYEGGLPEKPMRLYVNSWFPTWLSGEKPGSDRYSYVDWIER